MKQLTNEHPASCLPAAEFPKQINIDPQLADAVVLENQIWFYKTHTKGSIMARPPAKELTDRELEVMQAFWSHGVATAAEVREHLANAGLARAYTTIANLVRLLHAKGLLEQVNDERPFRYRAVRSFEDVSGSLVNDLLERVFGGSREQLLTRILEAKKLTTKEREALQRILKEKSQ